MCCHVATIYDLIKHQNSVTSVQLNYNISHICDSSTLNEAHVSHVTSSTLQNQENLSNSQELCGLAMIHCKKHFYFSYIHDDY